MFELPHATPAPEIDPDVVLVSIPDGYTPGPWEATEDEDCWRLLGRSGVPQILKAPKRNTPYAEYWPDPKDAVLILMAPTLALALKKVIAERDELRTRNRGLSTMVLKLMEERAGLEMENARLYGHEVVSLTLQQLFACQPDETLLDAAQRVVRERDSAREAAEEYAADAQNAHSWSE